MGFIWVNLPNMVVSDVLSSLSWANFYPPYIPRYVLKIVNIMALKFAANLSFAFQEHENFLQRYQAAKNAGSVNGCVNLKKIDTRKKVKERKSSLNSYAS